MKTYIALLRGINVGGQKLIKMERLRSALAEPDFINVTTYIQSGNIIFESKLTDSAAIEDKIKTVIEAQFGFEVPVTVITPEELLSTITHNPFIKENPADPTQPYVSFLSEKPNEDNLNKLKAINFGPDRFIENGKVLYIYYGGSAGKTKLSNTVIESKLKLKSTARNWKSVLKLYELATAIK